MSNRYFDPNGRMDPSHDRRAPPAPYGVPRGPPMKSSYPGGAPDPRYRSRTPQQQQQPSPSTMEFDAHFYDGSPTTEALPEQWPLPGPPIAPGSPRANGPPESNQRRPPPGPPRAEYYEDQDPVFNQSRQHARMPPGYRPHPRGPPPQRPHYGNGEWMGDAYGGPQGPFPPPSGYPRRPPQPPPPPHLRMVPTVVHHGVVPPPIAETQGRMRAGSRPGEPSENTNSLAPGGPGRVKIPSYYFEQRGNSPIPEVVTPLGGHELHEPPVQPQQDSNAGGNGSQQRYEASPEPPVLIRQASLGKKTRPTLTTIKSGERKRGSSGESVSTSSSQQQDPPSSKERLTPFVEEVAKLPGGWISETSTPLDGSSKNRGFDFGGATEQQTTAGAEVRSAKLQNSSDAVSDHRRSSEILAPDTRLEPVSPIESPTEERPKFGLAVSPIMTPPQLPTPGSPVTPSTRDELRTPGSGHQQSLPPRSPVTPSSQDGILSHRGLTHPNDAVMQMPRDDFSTDEEKRKLRDLTIDINAVREAEARGSMTSLPDLISRATRLASNLDRGKTASRMGLNFFDFNSSTDAVERLRAAEKKDRRSASLSDMLTAFPAPGAKDEVRRSRGALSAMLRRSQLPNEGDNGEISEKPERKYCGLPPQRFWLLLAVLVLVLLAAIIIPVALTVTPKDSNDTTKTPPPSNPELARCERQLTCENGGLNIIGETNSCSCLCIDGYTGSKCTTFSKTGCTTMSAGSTKKATVGEDIPRLLSSADPKFNIPLNGETLLGLFSKADLTCTSENALVMFNGAEERSASNAGQTLPERAASLGRRQIRNSPPSINTPSPSQSTSSDSIGSVIDFARVAVLYIFQQTTELDSATAAQEKLQTYFSGRGTGSNSINPKNITLGSGFSCDLSKQSLVWVLSNGTTVAS